jgi:predicted glycoside hydrolase/deacetylase ChbG (UPF0249 family)
MSNDSGIHLVVKGDDFGMSHAVNEGIVLAHREGILTQTTAQAPTPWILEAARLARQEPIPCGMHGTLTCDWDNLSWVPLTPGPSLRDEDGAFRRTWRAVREHVTWEDALPEVLAQVDRLRRLGFQLTHIDTHMGNEWPELYQEVCPAVDLPYLYPNVTPHCGITSQAELSTREDKLGWLTEWLEQLGPGYHLLVTHPGVASAELGAMTTPENPVRPWTEPYRVTDLKTLCAPEVRRVIERRGIRLVSLADCPTVS